MASVYKDKKSPYYQADIWIDGNKFSRSTRCKNERKAWVAAKQIEQALKDHITAQAPTLKSLKIDYIAELWLRDKGDHHAGEGPKINEYKVQRLVEYFGEDKSLADIGHDEVTKLINWRRQHMVGKGGKGRKKPRSISAFTVNDTTEQLKKLFTYCKLRGVAFKNEPKWSELWLDEPEERERYLSDAEEDRLDDALDIVRDDYEPLFQFSRATGKRKHECMTLEWSHVKWDKKVIERPGKRDRMVQVAITDTVRDIIWPLQGNHPKFVFTFEAKRTVDKVIKGRRYT
jgi:integrase